MKTKLRALWVLRLTFLTLHHFRPHKITGWDAGWLSRKYPLDFAGFAFHSDVLKKIEKPFLRGIDWDRMKRAGYLNRAMNRQEYVVKLGSRLLDTGNAIQDKLRQTEDLKKSTLAIL